MEASLIDHLSPEDQLHLAYAAWATLFLGLALWSCGVTFARGAVALILGAGLSLLGLWLPGRLGLGMSPYIGGAIGFIIGSIIGGWGFRWIQAVTLAACLGLAVAGLYYQWHVRHPATVSSIAMSRPAATLLVQIKPAINPGVYGALESLGQRVGHIQRVHLERMGLAGIGTAIAAILFAMGFPRVTATLITSALGALILVLAAFCLLHVYVPRLSDQLSVAAGSTYVIMAALAVVGLVIQCRFFLCSPDKSQERPQPS